MPGRPCATCVDPRISAINFDLALGLAPSTVIKKYDLSRSSLNRHKDAGHHQRVTAATAAADSSPALARQSAMQVSQLLEHAHGMLPRLLGFVQRAEAADDRSGVVRVSAELRKWIELLLHAYGAFPKNGPSIDARSVTINTIRDMSKAELLAIASGQSDDD